MKLLFLIIFFWSSLAHGLTLDNNFFYDNEGTYQLLNVAPIDFDKYFKKSFTFEIHKRKYTINFYMTETLDFTKEKIPIYFSFKTEF